MNHNRTWDPNALAPYVLITRSSQTGPLISVYNAMLRYAFWKKMCECCVVNMSNLHYGWLTGVLLTSSIFTQGQGLSCAYGKVRGTKNWAAIKTKNMLFCLYNLHYNHQGQNIICMNLNADAYSYLCLISHMYLNTIHNANMCCIYNTIVAINIHILLLCASGEAKLKTTENIIWMKCIILTSMLILKE